MPLEEGDNLIVQLVDDDLVHLATDTGEVYKLQYPVVDHPPPPLTPESNKRRCALIRKQLHKPLHPGETEELQLLQDKLEAHLATHDDIMLAGVEEMESLNDFVFPKE